MKRIPCYKDRGSRPVKERTLTRAEVEMLKACLPCGSRVVLACKQSPMEGDVPNGTMGYVTGVNNDGTVTVEWDDGSFLTVLHYGTDHWMKL